MKGHQPLVSVIIATYNRAYILPNAIDSVLNQTYSNMQIIVVDDGSTDGTADLVKKFDNIEYVHIEHAGQSAARNAGLSRVRGDFIASLDSDDVWHPEFLEKCLTMLEERQLDFVFTNWFQVSRLGERRDFLVGDPHLKRFIKKADAASWVMLDSDELKGLYLVSCPSPTSALVMRRSSMVSGWNNGIRIGEDWSLYLDMIFGKPCKAAFTLEKLWYKYEHNENIYDGRLRSEVLEILVEDEAVIISRYKHYLKPRELNLLKRRQVATLMEFSKHKLIRERNIKESWRLFYKSIQINSWYALDQIPKLVIAAVRNRKPVGPANNF